MSVEHALSCSFGEFDVMNCFCFCQKSVVTSVLNQLYNCCLGNSSNIDLLMMKMELTWMSVQRVSRVKIGG